MVHPIESAVTFTDFILEEQRLHPRSTGRFTILLEQLVNSAKIIGSHVRESGLVDILGKAGTTNAFAEEQQKLDIFTNNLLIKSLRASEQVHAIISEEEEHPVMVE